MLVLGCWAGCVSAAEIATNGLGGGPWTDPATWRGKVVPSAADDVVIQKNDVVVFDKIGDEKVTCRKLLIDPKGGLTFKTNSGKAILTVTDGIETFGVIRLDGTRSANDHFEIHLAGDAKAKREIKLGKFGALLLYGKADLPEGRKNVALVSPPPADPKDDLLAMVQGEGSVMIDWQRARVQNVKLTARKIDNTGARPNERIKLFDCQFTGPSRIHLEGCDTPEISRNTFDLAKGQQIAEPAIHVHSSPLAEIKHNAIKGAFAIGIAVNVITDGVVVGNSVQQCETGLQGGYGLPNLMIKQLAVRGCAHGVKLDGASGVVEDLLIEGATQTAYYQQSGNLQVNHLVIKDLDKKGLALHLDQGTLALLNSNVLPTAIKVAPQKPPEKPGPPPLRCQHYLIVGVKQAAAGSLVEVRTIVPPLPAGAADPNVRNSPAPLIERITPTPKSLTPLVVNAWNFDYAGKLQPAPEYGVRLLGPAPKEGAERPLLKAVTYRPPENGFRAAPNDPTPTLEVKLP